MEKLEKKSNRGRKPHNHGTSPLFPAKNQELNFYKKDPENPNNAKSSRLKQKNKNLDEIFKNRCQVCLMKFIPSRRNSDLKGRLKITCSKCKLEVHLGCYGLNTPYHNMKNETSEESINEFICEICTLKLDSSKLDCFICGNPNTYCRAYKKVFWKKDPAKFVHVLCGLFASNIRVTNWRNLNLELLPSENINQTKSQCAICLKYSLKSDVWKCSCCDKEAHYICMLIDKIFCEDDEEQRIWNVSLTLSPNYRQILTLDHNFKGNLLKNLKGFANNKTFQHLSNSHEKYDRTFIEGFLATEIESLRDEMKDLPAMKLKFGDYRDNSNILSIVFCPFHYHPVCCFTNSENPLIGCDYCDTWSHQSCLQSQSSNEKEVFAIEPFYCENCEEWFKKRGFLEEICDIKAKFEYVTPNKLSTSNSNVNNTLKDMKEEEKSNDNTMNSLMIKKEASSPKKPLNDDNNINNSAIVPEIHNTINNSNNDCFNFETLFDKLPIIGSRLPVEDLVQVMFLLEVLLENLMKNEETLERKQVVALLQLLASLPFKNHKILNKILTQFLNENFLEKEILNKLVTKLASIYRDNNNIMREHLDLNKERLHELNSLLIHSKVEIINHNESDGLEDEDNEVIIQEKSQITIPKERKSKIQHLKEMTERLITAQTMLISYHIQSKKIDINELNELLMGINKYPALEEMPEMKILMTTYKEYDAICQEINKKILRKNELMIKEKEEYQHYLKLHHDLTPEGLIRFTIDRRKVLLLENFTDIQASCYLSRIDELYIESIKTPCLMFLESQLNQFKFLNGVFMNSDLITPEILEKLFKESFSFIITSKDLPRFFDVYMEYKLWKGKVQIFQNLRKSHKISNYILQDKTRRLGGPGCTLFMYLANNIAIETSPRITQHNASYNLFEVLSMEHLGTLIKEAKQLVYLNMTEILYDLDALLKKSYHFQQTLKYILDSGMSKTTESPLEMEFSLEEIMSEMDECNLFFPIYYSFESQRKRFASLRNLYGIGQEFKFMPMPYANFEEEFFNKYKEKVLYEVYRFLQEKKVTKENLRQFSEYYLFFDKALYREKYPNEFKVLKDLNQHYLFLVNILNLSNQWSQAKIESIKAIIEENNFNNLNNNNDSSNNNNNGTSNINNNGFQVKLTFQALEIMTEKYNEYETLEQIYKECEIFLEELLKDFANEGYSIQYDWERHLGFFDKETILYEELNFPRLVGKYKLFLWLKQIHLFFAENIKDYSKYYYLHLSLRELIEKYGLGDKLEKNEVLYEQFQAFSHQINELLEEISRKIQDRLKLKVFIEENEIPMIEQNLKLMKEKINVLGLFYPIASKLISDFENCCLASKKATVLHNMIVKENKKIDYNAMKILIDFAKNFELCELFPSFINLRRIFEYYENLLSKVAVLKDAFTAKKHVLSVFKVPNIKVMQEKFIYTERVTYSKIIYNTLKNLMTYDQTKQMMEDLNNMKINIKAQRDLLFRYKSKTEVFAKNCEKLYHERKLQNLTETNVMDYLTSIVLSRNDLITNEVLSGIFVNDFRCYEWNLNVMTIQRGYLVFLNEYTQSGGSFEKFNKRFNNKKCQLSRQIMNSDVLFRELYLEGRYMQKLFETSKFYNPMLLEEMSVTIQTIERIKGQAVSLKLRAVQTESEEESIMDSLKIDKNYKFSLKTQRTLFLKTRDLDQFIKEIIETKINLEDEYSLFMFFKSKSVEIQKAIKNVKKSFMLGKRIPDSEIDDLVSKIVSLPINLEEIEDFIMLVFNINQCLVDKLIDFNRKSSSQRERLDFIKKFCSQSEQFLVYNEESNLLVKKVLPIIKPLENFLKKKTESPEGFSKLLDKSMKILNNLKKEAQNEIFPEDICLIHYTILILLMNSLFHALDQEKMMKFGALRTILQELNEFNDDFPNDVRIQKDFNEFCELYYKVQLVFREIGLQLKKKAYGIKNLQNNNGSNVKMEEVMHKGVDLSEELGKVLSLSEQEFINYFEPFDNITEIKRDINNTMKNNSSNEMKIEMEEEGHDGNHIMKNEEKFSDKIYKNDDKINDKIDKNEKIGDANEKIGDSYSYKIGDNYDKIRDNDKIGDNDKIPDNEKIGSDKFGIEKIVIGVIDKIDKNVDMLEKRKGREEDEYERLWEEYQKILLKEGGMPNEDDSEDDLECIDNEGTPMEIESDEEDEEGEGYDDDEYDDDDE